VGEIAQRFDIGKLRAQLNSQQTADVPFVGGQRIAGAIADFLNYDARELLNAIAAYQGQSNLTEPVKRPEPPAAPVNRHLLKETNQLESDSTEQDAEAGQDQQFDGGTEESPVQA
jgi:hypothetical protein